MSKHYLLFLPPDIIHKNVSYDQPRINVNVAVAQLQVDDKILLVRGDFLHFLRGNLLPFVYTVIYVNRGAGTVTLQLEQTHNQATPLPKDILLDMASGNIYLLSASDFTQSIKGMGGKRMEEKALLEHIQSYIRAHGYYFDNETLYNYHICLKVRPFIILAGLSGTGKSKLSQLYAEALGHKQHYLRLPVRPNWNDDRYLLGHLNTITGEYFTEPAVEFLMEANEDEDNLYFFCLDEMNLAHVEYYFSQFLSAMEGEQAEERQIRLYGTRMQKLLEEQDKTPTLPAQLVLPDNLFFTGTINVDETTQSISDKVIDRANTLEFFNVDKADLGLGYRVLHEIEVYLANSKELLAPLVAFDLQVKQRILPRIRGNEAISDMIKELQNYCKQNKLERSQKRLQEMEKRLKRDGYTNFWR